MTQEDIFKQMIKINKEKQVTSSRHMSYNQLMQHMGKKSFLKPLQEQTSAQKLKFKRQKKLRVTNSLEQSKEIDLPDTMKYRNYKLRPKKVEMGPSLIHRNGLFVYEE